MKRTVKKTAYTILFLLISSVTLVYIVFNSETFQNWLTGRITNYLGAKFKTNITIGHINYSPFTRFSMDNIYWGDQKNDTLFFVEHLTFNLGGFNLDSLKLSLNDVKLKGAYCKIITYKDSTFNIDVLFNILDPKDTIPSEKKFKLFFNRVQMTDSRFRLIDSTKEFEKEGFDGFNQDFSKISFYINNFWIIKDSLNFDIKQFSCYEQCGVEFKKLSSKISIGKSGIIANELDASTNYSHIARKFEMLYNGWSELADYNDKVNMIADLKGVKLDMRDIACIAPFFKNKKQIFFVDGKMTGPVKNIRGKNLVIKFGENSRFEGKLNLKGLPDIGETFIDVNAEKAITNSHDLEYLIGNIMPNEFSRLGKIRFKGHYTGFYNDFVAFGEFDTDLGDINSDINMKLNQQDSLPTYSGKIALNNFDIGKIFNVGKYVGRTTLNASINGKSFDLKTHQSKFSSDIKYLYANGYNYQNISINGSVNKKIFEGKLALNDPHAKLDFNGTIDLHSEAKKFNFKADIKNADLKALKLHPSNNLFSTKVDINFTYRDIDNNHGTILLDDILFVTDSLNHRFKQVKAETKFDGINKLFRIQSQGLDVEMKGDFTLLNMSVNVQNIFSSIFPEYVSPINKKMKPENFSYKLSINNSDLFSDVFYPNFRIYDLSVEGKMHSEKNELSLNGVASSMKYNNFTFKNIVIKSGIDNNSRGQVIAGIDELLYNDTSILKDFTMLTKIQKNRIINQIKISDTLSRLSAEIFTTLDFQKGVVNFKFQPSIINYRKKQFLIPDSSKFSLTDSSLFFDHFNISQGKSSISFYGSYDFNEVHDFHVDLNDLNMDLVNVFSPKLNIEIGGTLNGSLTLKGNNHQSFLTANAKVEHLSLDKDTFGDYILSSNYSEKQQRFLVYAKSLNGKLNNFEAGGYISTAADKEINIDVVLTESDIHFLQPFMKEYVLIYDGIVSAKCKISGTTEKIRMNGQVDLSKIDYRIDYLKTRYKFSTSIEFDESLIKIKPTKMFDEFGKSANVEGSISHSDFRNMDFNINVNNIDRMHLLNTSAKDNSLFYGSAYGSGSVTITGAIHDFLLETDLTTEKGTHIYIPLSSGSESDNANFINFINKDTLIKVVIDKSTELSGFELNSTIHSTPDAEFELILDEITGDKIKGRGTGTVQLVLPKIGNFAMYGQVIVDGGEYGFTAANIFKKKFILSRGGTLSWNGDPMQTQMDIEGMYYLRKVSISELVSSTTTASNSGTSDNKVPVECLLYVKGSIASPEIKFDLNFPDLQSSVGTNTITEIQNVVRTLRSEPDLMNQQVMSLMLFGKFVPLTGNNANSANPFNTGYATTLSGILTSQANGLFGNIIPGLDFNLDYQNSTDITKSRTIISASKKFYNNRLEVQTSYDPQFANNANISTQYSISKDGNLKIKAYSKNTNDPIYRTNALTQGIGLYYRKEFDTFLEMFGKNKSK